MQPPRSQDPSPREAARGSTFAVLIGPSASGKTTVGELLAASLHWPFVDADDLHPPSNRARMQQGLPLQDEHRWPWLDAVHGSLRAFADRGEDAVLACSALKRSYRDRIRGGLAGVRFFDLVVPAEVLRARIERRRGHFFPPGLLQSQLATIEHGDDAEAIDGSLSPAAIVAAIRLRLQS